MRLDLRRLFAILSIVAAASAPVATSAQDAAPFFKGKTIRIVIGVGVGGGYADYARLLAEHMGRHLAGAPQIIVQTMPGAGGLLAANWLYAQAPQDGTVIGIVTSAVPLAPLWGKSGARFETLKFNWLGTLDTADAVCFSWHASPIKTWADMLSRKFTVGSNGAGSPQEAYPAMLNKLFGTRIKVIGGYKGGGDIDLAIERGEIDGRCGGHFWALKALHPDWWAERKVAVPILIAEKRSPELPDTPAIMEFVKDDATRAQLDLVLVAQNLYRPVLLPPGVPPARVQELRDAFDATLADKAFRADAEKRKLNVDPVRGEDMARQLARAFAFPPDVVAAVRDIMGGN
jgi:tripartite-type tricarboxylate transporter receptor subunit TctC